MATMMGQSPGVDIRDDKMSVTLAFADGSIGTVHYFASGHKSYPKETLEVFSEGRVLRMENFRITHGYGFPKFKVLRTRRQDKGHNAEVVAFIDAIGRGGAPLIPFSERSRTSSRGSDTSGEKSPMRLPSRRSPVSRGNEASGKALIERTARDYRTSNTAEATISPSR